VSATADYIKRLEALKEGERSRLRSLAGRPLDTRLDGFDLFTGLWWPLRNANPRTPRREPSWLIAKLHGSFGVAVPHIVPEGARHGRMQPAVLGRCEPRGDRADVRFRTRFDTLLCSPLSGLEPHLRWALGEVARANEVEGLDWAILLDDLSLWDRGYNPDDRQQTGRLRAHAQSAGCGEEHGSPQDLWACAYLRAARHRPQGD